MKNKCKYWDPIWCPKCGSESYSTTLVGYILNMDKKEDYKDKNRCVCQECGDVHTTHDRLSVTPEMLKNQDRFDKLNDILK